MFEEIKNHVATGVLTAVPTFAATAAVGVIYAFGHAVGEAIGLSNFFASAAGVGSVILAGGPLVTIGFTAGGASLLAVVAVLDKYDIELKFIGGALGVVAGLAGTVALSSELGSDKDKHSFLNRDDLQIVQVQIEKEDLPKIERLLADMKAGHAPVFEFSAEDFQPVNT